MPNLDNSKASFSFNDRNRQWNRFKTNPAKIHNVLIIGGGIVGAGVLREFSLHKIPDVILVEKGDFSSGTSGASSKLIHAGIRYLEQSWDQLKALNFKAAFIQFRFVFYASAERKILNRIAPHLIKPKKIFLVIGKNNKRNPFSVFLGTWAYYLLQLFQGQFFSPPSLFIGTSSISKHFPELEADEIKSIHSFWDSQTDDARLVLETVRSGYHLGGNALNYVEVKSVVQRAGIWLIDLLNLITGETIQVQSKLIVNASGAYMNEVLRLWGGKTPVIDRVSGCHLDFYPALADKSFYITAGDGRLVFVLNRDEDGTLFSRVGTTEKTLPPDAGSHRPKVSEEEVNYLLGLTNKFFKKKITVQDVVHSDAGIRPLALSDKNPFEKSREHRILHEGDVYHVMGVKLTDFRRVSSELMSRIAWDKYSIDPDWQYSSTETPLNSGATCFYPEKSTGDFLNNTMVLQWEDYVERRRGLKPTLMKMESPAELQKIYDEFQKELGWKSLEI